MSMVGLPLECGGLPPLSVEQWELPHILFAVEIVQIHTNPKRQRGNDLWPSLAHRVSISLNREQYNAVTQRKAAMNRRTPKKRRQAVALQT